MEQARAIVRGRSKDIKQDLGRNSAEGREALADNFRRARKAIADSMGGAEKVTAEGMKEIRRLFVKSLALYGLSPQHARGRDPVSGQLNIPKGEGRQFQRGGPINMGAPSGDSVPAMLERGEYVMNRNAVKKVGRAALDRINFGAAPRFQQGGIVELLHPGNDPEGHGDHLHVAAKSMQAIVAIGKRLQKLGWQVSEHPAFGGVNFRHAPGGYHYTGQAIDVNWPDAGSEAAKIRALLPMLGSGLAGRSATSLARGPTSWPPSRRGAAGTCRTGSGWCRRSRAGIRPRATRRRVRSVSASSWGRRRRRTRSTGRCPPTR
jgi:hypothetical protein